MNKWNIFKKHGSFLSKLAFAGLVLASIILEFLAVRSHMTLANSLCDSPYFDPVANVCYMLIACIVVLTLTICGLCVVVDESVKNYYKKRTEVFIYEK